MTAPAESELRAQHCRACGAIVYFQRPFCPTCGSADVGARTMSGSGFVRARTIVRRPPTPELQVLAPFALFLVEADEGFRFMAHGPKSLKIGDRVRSRMANFADVVVPYVEKPA